jgi:beta-lactamase superfamily II metal-dependent hydrolase
MARPDPLSAARFVDDDFVAAANGGDLVYVLCNVGDADAQVVLLPAVPPRTFRQVVVVDAGATGKLPALIDAFVEAKLVAPAGHAEAVGSIALVVATHPHDDHLRGMPELLARYAADRRIAEFWDPGYWHTIDAYHDTMAEIARQAHLVYAQPTSGFRRWIGSTAITVLSPSVQLRNRFDTYGTELNDSSISLRIEAPAIRVIRDEHGQRVIRPDSSRIVLGADAQTLSWSFVLTEFPFLAASTTEQAKLLDVGSGTDVLRADVLKVSHHGSKHGVNLELVERMKPGLTLISSVRVGG